jgi:hypothetical protein
MIRRLSWIVVLGAIVGCDGASTESIETAARRLTPEATSETQRDCFIRVKQTVLDGVLPIEAYEAALVAECGATSDGGAAADPSPTPSDEPDLARLECYNAVKSQAIAEGWSGEAYEAALVAECGATSDGGAATDPSPTPSDEPDLARLECYNAVKSQAIAEGWSGEAYEAELVARCETPAAGGD